MTILWDESYCTGVRQIDEQHQKLFRFVDALDRMVDDGIESGAEVDHLMVFLGAYVRTHFAYEEPCMARYRCPTAGANKKAHREFLAFYDGIHEEYRSSGGSLGLVRRLRDKMDEWLVEHICRIDAGLRTCVLREAALSKDR